MFVCAILLVQHLTIGLKARAHDPKLAIKCLSMAIEKFEDVLNSQTNSKSTLTQCAKVRCA